MPGPQPRYYASKDSWFANVNGKRINLGKTKDEAFKTFYQLMADSSGTLPSHQAGTNSNQVFDDWITNVFDQYLQFVQSNRAASTFKSKKEHIERFLQDNPNLAKKPISYLRPIHVQNWVDKKSTWGPNYTATVISTLQTGVRWSRKMGLIEKDVLEGLEKPKRVPRKSFVSVDDFQKLIGLYEKNDPFRNLVIFAWETGCRPQEIFRMTTGDIDFENKTIVMQNTKAKGHRNRRIILTDKAIEVLKQYAREDNEPMFRNSSGAPWTKDSINCRFQRAKTKLGKKICLYEFRHGFATDLITEGADSAAVAELMGHSSTRMVSSTYAHLNENPKYLASELAKRATQTT